MKTNDLIPEDQLLKLNKLKEKLPKDEDNETYLEDKETVETVLTESDTKSEPIAETEVTESDTPTVEVPKPETEELIARNVIGSETESEESSETNIDSEPNKTELLEEKAEPSDSKTLDPAISKEIEERAKAISQIDIAEYKANEELKKQSNKKKKVISSVLNGLAIGCVAFFIGTFVSPKQMTISNHSVRLNKVIKTIENEKSQTTLKSYRNAVIFETLGNAYKSKDVSKTVDKQVKTMKDKYGSEDFIKIIQNAGYKDEASLRVAITNNNLVQYFIEDKTKDDSLKENWDKWSGNVGVSVKYFSTKKEAEDALAKYEKVEGSDVDKKLANAGITSAYTEKINSINYSNYGMSESEFSNLMKLKVNTGFIVNSLVASDTDTTGAVSDSYKYTLVLKSSNANKSTFNKGKGDLKNAMITSLSTEDGFRKEVQKTYKIKGVSDFGKDVEKLMK